MKRGLLVMVAALLMTAGSGCSGLKHGRQGCSAGCSGGCNQCGQSDPAHGVAINAHGECQCSDCRGNGHRFGAAHGGGGVLAGGGGSGDPNQLGREYRASRRIQGPAGPPTAQVAYPYYTIRGPRDFLSANPPSIGP